MGDLDRIITVNITRQTAIPSEPSFSDILIAAEFLTTEATPNYGTNERVRLFSSLSEIGTAFGTAHVVYFMASAIFAQNPSVAQVYVGRKLTGIDGTETWTAALDAMVIDNPNFYGIVAGTRLLADQQTIAAWTESNDRLYGISSGDVSIPDSTGDIAEYINAQNYERSFVLYHPDAGTLLVTDKYPAEAWMGKMFPKDPGSATWAFKTLSGVPSYALTGAQIATIEGKEGNFYTDVAGIDITQFGTVGLGEYIDVIRGVDWLKSRIQTLAYLPLIQQDKIPYTNEGIQTVVGQVRAALQEGVDAGLLSVFEVTAPDVADVSITDKGNRVLPDIDFTATLTGAIHKVTVTGTVSL